MRNWCIALLFLLGASSVCAAEYDVGAAAYAKGDYEAAFVQWRTLARQGDTRAQYSLARMYAGGIGVAEDDEAALYWFRAAARQGSVEAQSELALMFSLGRGVRQDHTLAAYWYGRLAEDGHATAQFLLAGMYEDAPASRGTCPWHFSGTGKRPSKDMSELRQSSARCTCGATVPARTLPRRGCGSTGRRPGEIVRGHQTRRTAPSSRRGDSRASDGVRCTVRRPAAIRRDRQPGAGASAGAPRRPGAGDGSRRSGMLRNGQQSGRSRPRR